MKQSLILEPRRRRPSRLALTTLFSALVLAISSSAEAQVALSSESQGWLQTAISTGTADFLRWPNFSDYSKHVQKFYGLNGNSLWWSKKWNQPHRRCR